MMMKRKRMKRKENLDQERTLRGDADDESDVGDDDDGGGLI